MKTSILFLILSVFMVSTAKAEFVFTFEARTGNLELDLSTHPAHNYNYTVDIDDGAQVFAGITGNFVYTFQGPGNHRIKVTEKYPNPYLVGSTAAQNGQVISIDQWGSQQWESMDRAFQGVDTVILATDVPDLSQVTNMSLMFASSNIGYLNLNGWDVSSVEDMSYLFADASFVDPQVGLWNVSSVTDMRGMFSQALSANPDVVGWDVSSVTHMGSMFWNADAAAPDVSGWNTSSVVWMRSMFQDANLANPDVSNWDTSSLEDASYLFKDATSADPDLSGWKIDRVTGVTDMLANTGLTTDNYDRLLINFANQNVMSGLDFSAGSTPYCYGEIARNFLENAHAWTVTDGDKDCSHINIAVPFVTTWEATASNPTIDLPNDPNFPGQYLFDVDIGNDGSFEYTGLVEDFSHTFPSPGFYTIGIKGFYPSPNFDGSTAATDGQLLSVDQWGDIRWLSMHRAFSGVDTQMLTTDAPDLSLVTDMSYMFDDSAIVNLDTSHWDVSFVTDMNGLFYRTTAINADVSEWDVSSVTDMSSLFAYTSNWNPNIRDWDVSSVLDMKFMFWEAADASPEVGDWDVSSVINMSYMFGNTPVANPQVSGWGTSSVTDMSGMFQGANAAHPDVSGWDVSSVTRMSYMFGGSSANPIVGGWNVSSVTDMTGLFYNATAADPNVSNWITSSLTDTSYMFANASNANPDVSNWDVSSVQNMRFMFWEAAAANPDLASWQIPEVINMTRMLENSGLTTSNYDAMLVNFDSQNVMSGVTFGAFPTTYCNADTEHASLTSADGWVITDGGFDCSPPDTTAPAPPVFDPVNENTNPITGLSEPGALITLDAVNCDNTPVITAANGLWSCVVPASDPLQPTTVISATATDDAGNESDPSSIIVGDTAANQSVSPTIDPVANGATEITGTAVPDSIIEFGYGIFTCANSTVVADAWGNWKCTSPSFDVTTGFVVIVTATQPGLSVSPAVTTTVYDPGVTSPPAPQVDPTDGTFVSGSTIADGLITVYNEQSIQLCSTIADASGNFNCTPLSPSPVVDDVLSVIVTDGDGNSSLPTRVTVQADIVAPAPPIINPVNVGTDPITGLSEPGTLIILGMATCDNDPVITAANGVWSCDVPASPPLMIGTVISATATDASGNVSDPSSTTVGALSGQSESPTFNPVANGATQVTGTAIPGSIIHLGGGAITCFEPEVVADASGNWICTSPSLVPVTGDVISATATQFGLSVSPAVTTTVYDPGVTSPPAPQVDPTDGTFVSGSTIADGLITVYNEQSIQLCSTIADASGNFNCTPLSPSPVVDDVLSVIVTDGDGNSSLPTRVTVQADIVAPAPPIINPVNVGTDPITGLSEPGTLIILGMATCDNDPVITAANGVWSCDVPASPPLMIGTVISATATDASGNVSDPSSTTVGALSGQSESPTFNPVANGATQVTGTAIPGSIIHLGGGAITCFEPEVVADASGNWICTSPSLVPVTGDVISATATQFGLSVSPAVTTTVYDPGVTSPPAPQVDPTDGTFVSGSTIADGLITVYNEQSIQLCSTIADASGNFNCTPLSPSPVVDDVLSVIVTDGDGNSSLPTRVTVQADIVAPAPPIINPVNVGTDPITGLSEPGALITLDAVNCDNTPVITAANGLWSCVVPASDPLQPTTVISATATDDAGNESDPSSIIVGDTAANQSVSPTIDPVANGATEITGTAVPDSIIEFGYGIFTCANSTVVADAWGNWKCTSPSFDVTTGFVVIVTATQPGLSVSPAVTTTVYDPGVTSPPAPQVDPTDGTFVSGSTIADGLITVYNEQSIQLCSTIADASGNFNCTPLSPSPVVDDVLSVIVTDGDGNSSLPTRVTVQADIVAPAPPIINPVNVGTDPITGLSEPGTLIILGMATCDNDPVITAANGVWSCDVPASPPLMIGTVISATATDASGNVSDPSSTTVGALSGQSESPTFNPVANGATQVTGTAIPGSIIHLGGGAITCFEPEVVADASGNWICTSPSLVPVTGDVISATATQFGLSVSPAVTTTVYDPGVTSPPAPQVDPTDGTFVSGSTIADGLITVYNEQSIQLCSTIADASGNFNCTPLSPSPVVDDVLSVIVTDGDGNSSLPTRVTVQADIVAPAPPIINPVNVGTDPITGLSEPGTLIILGMATCDNDPVITAANGVWSCDVPASPPLMIGTVISATATDASGNVSDPSSTTVGALSGQSESPTFNPVANGATQVTGTAIPGSIIHLGGGAITCFEPEVVADASGNWICTSPSLVPVTGDVISATATQFGLSVSPAVTTTVYDPGVTSPPAPQVDPTDGTFVSGSTIADGLITVYNEQSIQLCSTIADASGNFNCTPLSPSPVVDDVLSVIVTDGDGNSSLPTRVTVQADIVAPAPPIINPVNVGTDPITGLSEPGTLIILGMATCDNDPVITAANGVWSCDVPASPPLMIGTVISATATDASGNVSDPSSTTVGALSGQSESPTFNPVANGATQVTGTAIPGSIIHLGGGAITCFEPEVVADASGNWICTSPSLVPVTGDVISATATQFGLSVSPAVTTTVYDPGVTSPPAPQVDPTDGTFVSGSTIADGLITVYNEQSIQLCSTIADASGNFNCTPLSPSPVVDDVLSVIVTDGDGNSSLPTRVTVQADIVAPAPPIINPVNVGTDPITGLSEPGTLIILGMATCDNDPVITAANGVWSCDVPASPPLMIGTVISATATDASGNVSDPSSTTVGALSGQSESPTFNPVANGATQVTGTAIPGSIIHLGGGAITCFEPEVVADASGNWICTSPSLVPVTGDVISATATQFGLSVSPAVTTTVYDPGVTSPPAPQVDPTDGTFVSGSTIADGLITVYNEQSIQLCSTIADASGNFNCTPLSPSPVVDDVLSVIVTDGDGNSSLPTRVTVQADIVAPAPPIINPVNVGTDPITGLSEPGTLIILGMATCDNDPVITAANGVWSCDVPASPPLMIGTVISATATDASGNVSDPSSTTVGALSGQSESPTFNPVANGATQVTGTAIPGSIIHLGGGAITCFEPEVVADASGNWICTSPSLVPVTGDVISATATQFGLSVSPAVTTTVYDPGVTSPPAPQVDPTDGTFVSGSTIADGLITVYNEQSIQLCSTIADASGNFNCTPLSPSPVVDDVLSVIVTDGDGNSSLPTRVTVQDLQAPDAPVINDPTSGLTVSGTGEPGATVDVITTSGASCSDLVDGSGNWSCDLSPEPVDGEIVTATQTDLAGNESEPATATVGYRPDLSIFISNCVSGLKVNDPVLYEMTISNNGNIDIFGATINATMGSNISPPDWLCMAPGAATCDTVNGSGDVINEVVNIPAGDQLVYVLDTTVTGGLFDFIDVQGSVGMPVGTTDVNVFNNVAEDSDLIDQFIFKGQFECVAPGTIGSSTELLESLLH